MYGLFVYMYINVLYKHRFVCSTLPTHHKHPSHPSHPSHITPPPQSQAPYLPRDNGTAASSPYSEGGALYALGIIHANQGQDIRPFLTEALRGSSHEVIQHGACLGLGIAGLGTADEELFEELKSVLFLDNAVAGEAAGLAMGLIAVGTATDKSAEMLAYAHDTQVCE